MDVGILNQHGDIVVRRNLQATPEAVLQVMTPYLADLVVAAEGIFTWDLTG